MKQFTIVSLFIMLVSSFSSSPSKCQNSSFVLTYNEDKRAFHSRHFHIFYENGFKNLAEMIECRVAGTVKKVSVEEIQKGTLKEICKSKIYSSKLEDKLKKKNYMTTITKQSRYSDQEMSCDAMNQFNLIQTGERKWAVLIRGHATDILLPIKSNNGIFTNHALDFVLNSLFFATAYGFGESTFKSLGGDTGVKGQLLFVTFIVYCLAVLVAIVALVILVALFFIKRNANIKKRESEKSKLLRNPANNTDDDTPVEIVYENPSKNK